VGLSVCLPVCLSVSEDISGTTRAIFTKFLCMLHVSVARSSSDMFTIGRIAYRREGVFFPIENALSTGKGDESAQRGRSMLSTIALLSVLLCESTYRPSGQVHDPVKLETARNESGI